MARYQIILAYDGTEFRGYQRQAAHLGGRTVQGVFERALQRIGWSGGSSLAAGRTDTGVHASGQVVAFDLDWKHHRQDLQLALNANLPPDVAVREVRLAKPDFHPRYDAISRRYRYQIFCQAVRDPLQERYAWRVWPAVDLTRMSVATQDLLGTHDFAAFGTPPRSGGSTVRSVSQAAWQVKTSGWTFEVTADAFLYRMVRRLVYSLVAIGQGKLELHTIRELLDGGAQTPVQGVAPSHGLTLVEVVYPSACVLEA